MTDFDKMALEVLCGKHRDLLCLCDKATYSKVAKGITQFGPDRFYELLTLMCACEIPSAAPTAPVGVTPISYTQPVSPPPMERPTTPTGSECGTPPENSLKPEGSAA